MKSYSVHSDSSRNWWSLQFLGTPYNTECKMKLWSFSFFHRLEWHFAFGNKVGYLS